MTGNPDYRPIYDDIVQMTGEFNLGRLSTEGEAICFEPRPVTPGTLRYGSGHRSSAMELLLFMMPALFHCDFRTKLELGGVTHSPFSCPTSFVKEALLSALEQIGLYGSLMLQRFGFHGSGGGSIEARIYPREERRGKISEGRGSQPEIAGVKIIISHLDTSLAEIEKELIAKAIGIDAGRISIIEVMESDGPGNGVQVFTTINGLPAVLSREMLLYNTDGELSFSEESLRGEIAGLAQEVKRLMDGMPPERLVRELYPYWVLTGTGPASAGESPGIAKTRELCEILL